MMSKSVIYYKVEIKYTSGLYIKQLNKPFASSMKCCDIIFAFVDDCNYKMCVQLEN